MLFLVGKEVGEGEAVVTSDKIDRGGRFASAFAVKIGRTEDALDHFTDRIVVAAEEAARGIAEFPVPFHPASVVREIADLVKSARVPGLGDEFAVGQNRVVGDGLEERRIGQGIALRVAAEDRRKVEAESVDVVFGRPIAQAIEDEIAHHGVVAIEGVAAAAEVEVIAVGGEEVVCFVVEPAERNNRPGRIAFGRVVEDHVEDDLDAGGVEGLDQILELVDLLSVRAARGEAGLRSAEGQRAVTPVVAELVARFGVGAEIFVLVEFEDGHEFHAVDAEGDKVGNFFAQAVEGARSSHAGGGVLGEPAHVHFVDDQFRHRQIQGTVVLPVEVVFRDASAVRKDVAFAAVVPEDLASARCAGERVEQDVPRIETVAGVRVEWSLHAVAVFQVRRVQVEDHHGEDVAHAEFRREGDLGEGPLGAFLEKDQRATGRVRGEDREIHSARHEACTERQRMAIAQAEDAVVVRRDVLAGRLGHAGFSGARGSAYFHLMLQPMLGCCGSGAGWPVNAASSAARKSSPVQGTLFPGVLASIRPW